MRRLTSEQKLTDERKRVKKYGMPKPTEQSSNGQNHRRLRRGPLSQKHQRGDTLSVIECDKKQGRYKCLEHWREELKSGAGNTPNVTNRVLSPERVKTL